eukprot:scaffold2910_cov390-Prasinococcus_capsulatus_cf.AAC.44
MAPVARMPSSAEMPISRSTPSGKGYYLSLAMLFTLGYLVMQLGSSPKQVTKQTIQQLAPPPAPTPPAPPPQQELALHPFKATSGRVKWNTDYRHAKNPADGTVRDQPVALCPSPKLSSAARLGAVGAQSWAGVCSADCAGRRRLPMDGRQGPRGSGGLPGWRVTWRSALWKTSCPGRRQATRRPTPQEAAALTQARMASPPACRAACSSPVRAAHTAWRRVLGWLPPLTLPRPAAVAPPLAATALADRWASPPADDVLTRGGPPGGDVAGPLPGP